jgi:thiamine kinase-like enzyme
MVPAPFLERQVRAILDRQTGELTRTEQLHVQPLRGGLVAPSVQHVVAHYTSSAGRHQTALVVKQLQGEACREASIYEALMRIPDRTFAPALLGVERVDGQDTRLYLEAIASASEWPWRDTLMAGRVLEALSRLHTSEDQWVLRTTVADWNYEDALAQSAWATLEFAECVRHEIAPLKRAFPALRGVVSDLPRIRVALMNESSLPRTVLHGDAHPGNVIVRQRGELHEPVFLDWERARLGSPLEDVSSWLQSLGYWEPAVKRKHDTLLGRYLEARGLEARPNRALRDAYWAASASNMLAGALRYHLHLATDPQRSADERSGAYYAASDALRMIRRAYACWR